MRLFISYSHIDKQFLDQLIPRISEFQVHEIWYDKILHGGANWWAEIESNIQGCECFLALLSADYFASEYCIKELKLANELRKAIVPIVVRPQTQVPNQLEFLQNIQYIDLSNGININSVSLVLNSLTIIERGQKNLFGSPKNPSPAEHISKDQLLSKLVNAKGNFQLSMVAEYLFDHHEQIRHILRGHIYFDPTREHGVDLERLAHAFDNPADKEIYIDEFSRMAHRTILIDSFMLIRTYCEITNQSHILQTQPWYHFVRIVNEAIAFDNVYRLSQDDLRLLPIQWSNHTITKELNGKSPYITLPDIWKLFNEMYDSIESDVFA